jgi:hypothetical protein
MTNEELKKLAAEKRASRNLTITIPVFDNTAVTLGVGDGPEECPTYVAGKLNAFGMARLGEYRAFADRRLKEFWLVDEKGYFVFADEQDEIDWDMMATYLRDFAVPILAADFNHVLSFDTFLSWDKTATLDFVEKCRAAVFELNPAIDPTYVFRMAGNAQAETQTEAGAPIGEEEAEAKN